MTDEQFLDLFEEDLFIPDLRAQDKEGVLREFVETLHQRKRIFDKEIVLDMLLRRESLGSTAVGKGVAIPHGRTLTTRKLIVAFGRCKEGMDFDAPDRKPVYLFFVLIGPYREKGNQYLPALGKVAEFCQKRRVRKELLQVSTFREFRDVFLKEMGLQ